MVGEVGIVPGDQGFSCRDRRAIDDRISAYPGWSVAYAVADGVAYARITPDTAIRPVLTLARRDGLTGFAARWADGSEFCTACLASLSTALGYIVQTIEGAFEAEGSADGQAARGCAGPSALTLACRTPI